MRGGTRSKKLFEKLGVLFCGRGGWSTFSWMAQLGGTKPSPSHSRKSQDSIGLVRDKPDTARAVSSKSDEDMGVGCGPMEGRKVLNCGGGDGKLLLTRLIYFEGRKIRNNNDKKIRVFNIS